MGVPNVLIWHVHGSYLNYIVRARANFFLPVKPDRPEGYGGKGWTFRWPANVYEVPAEEVRSLKLDLVIHQTPKNYLEDQYEVLSEAQRTLPRIYLEHNTPKGHPTDTKHPVDDPNVLLVHVTHFNRMMWDSGRCPTMVIEHGVALDEDVRYVGDLDQGVVVVNGLKRRNRIAGYDVWEQMRRRVPLQLVGMESEELGGLGDIPHVDLLQVEARYRFFFNPIRYTSLPLALVEAMAVGMPIVALATTEVPTVVEDGRNGFVSNDLDYLTEAMLRLLSDRREATRMGRRSREIYRERFSIERFCRDWERAFALVMGNSRAATEGQGE
ncbi:MAG: glycosyltransferase [Sphingomonadaceae bacterium]